MNKKALDNLLGIEQALWVIAFAILWKPLGVFVLIMLFIQAYLGEKEEKQSSSGGEQE